MSPDDPNLIGLNGSLNNSMYSPLMGLATALLQSGGPSPMPVSFGQALGAGMQNAQQFQQAGIQNAMQRLMLGKTGLQMNMLQDALGQAQQPPQAQQQSMPPMQGNVSQPGSFDISQGIGQPPQVQTAQPASTSVDPYSDPVYLRNQKLAQTLDMMQPGSGAGYAAAAAQRIDYLSKERAGLWQTVDPKDYQSLGLPKQQPGVTWQRNTQTGEVVPKGESTIKDVQYMDPGTGMPVHQLYDTGSGRMVGPNPSPSRTPGTPLPGPLESNAQGLADYTMDLDKINARGMTGPILKARAKELNPTWDETTYKAKQSLATDFAKGASGKALLAFNTATSHLDTMAQAANALQNGDVQMANRISNAFGVQMGKDPVTNFNTVKQLVAGEVAKAIAGGNVAEGDREKANAVLNAVNSPQQLQGAIAQIRNLMGGKLAALKTSYESMGLPNFEKKLTPAALASMQNFESQNQPQTSGKTLTYDPASGTFK